MKRQDVKAAFGSAYAQIGIVLSAVSIFSFIQQHWQFGLSSLLLVLVHSFRMVFHPVVDWFGKLLGLHLSEIWKDALVVYAAIGASMARTLARPTIEYASSITWLFTEKKSISARIAGLLQWSFLLSTGTLWAYVFWPAAILYLLRTPFEERRVSDDSFGGHSSRQELISDSRWYVYCDVRVVFVLQLAVMALAVALITLLNAIAVS